MPIMLIRKVTPSLRLLISGMIIGRYNLLMRSCARFSFTSAFFRASSRGATFTAIQGVKTKAATREKNMAEAPSTGIGRM